MGNLESTIYSKLCGNGPTSDNEIQTEIKQSSQQTSNETHETKHDYQTQQNYNANNKRIYRKTNDVQRKHYKFNTDTALKIKLRFDGYIGQMLKRKISEIVHQQKHGIDILPNIKFPAPNIISIDENKEIYLLKTSISCTNIDKINDSEKNYYELALIDEYFGDLSEDHKYDSFNKFDMDRVNIHRPNDFHNLSEAEQFFYGIIYEPIYSNKYISNIPKLFNEWNDINIYGLKGPFYNKKTYSVSPKEWKLDGESSDNWLSLIAFAGFAAHRTHVISEENELKQHSGSYFVNDTAFLSDYNVRDGYHKYGATAYFDNKYCITKIYLCHDGKTYYPNTQYLDEWEHAKFVWRVSITVSVFLVDMVGHCRFRELNGLIKAIQTTLYPEHPIRRILLPFTFGTVYANRVYNEYLKENGLFHRCFAFKYKSLSRLISDTMCDAPLMRVHGIGGDDMKYRFKLIQKKIISFKTLPIEIFPFYTDIMIFWQYTLEFVTKYISNYYNNDINDDSECILDEQLKEFYNELLIQCGIDNKYRLKKFNLINMLTHFICSATIWNEYLSSSVSFNYHIHPNFNGLKIINNDEICIKTEDNQHILGQCKGNNIQNYGEYCVLALSKGWNIINFNHCDNIWSKVILDDDKYYKNRDIFTEYFEENMGVIMSNQRKRIQKQTTIIPSKMLSPQYFGPSVII